MLENIGFFVVAGAIIWGVRWILAILNVSCMDKVEEKQKSSTSVFALFVGYFSLIFVILSYSFYGPCFVFAIGLYKTFAWITAVVYIGAMIYATITVFKTAAQHKTEYGFGKGYCWAVAFIINWFNVTAINTAVYALFETIYKNMDVTSVQSMFVNTVAIAIFVFDVVMLIKLLKTKGNDA